MAGPGDRHRAPVGDKARFGRRRWMQAALAAAKVVDTTGSTAAATAAANNVFAINVAAQPDLAGATRHPRRQLFQYGGSVCGPAAPPPAVRARERLRASAVAASLLQRLGLQTLSPSTPAPRPAPVQPSAIALQTRRRLDGLAAPRRAAPRRSMAMRSARLPPCNCLPALAR